MLIENRPTHKRGQACDCCDSRDLNSPGYPARRIENRGPPRQTSDDWRSQPANEGNNIVDKASAVRAPGPTIGDGAYSGSLELSFA